MLLFGAKPPFSFEKFLQKCEGLIPESAIALLRQIQNLGIGKYKGEADVTLRKMHSFEIALRNELVKIRASRKRTDSVKYMRQDGEGNLQLSHIALSAHRNTSPLEAEKFLDSERWRMLDESATGHYFDLDLLIIYAQKLLILERWERINTANKAQLLEETLKGN